MKPTHEPMKAVDRLALEVAGRRRAVPMSEVLEALRAGGLDALESCAAVDAALAKASGEEANA